MECHLEVRIRRDLKATYWPPDLRNLVLYFCWLFTVLTAFSLLLIPWPYLFIVSPPSSAFSILSFCAVSLSHTEKCDRVKESSRQTNIQRNTHTHTWIFTHKRSHGQAHTLTHRSINPSGTRACNRCLPQQQGQPTVSTLSRLSLDTRQLTNLV